MITDNWEYNVFGIYNYNKPGKLEIFYDWLKHNHDRVEGDILEAGVFRGKTILSTALLLKELGSEKKVYGFDSFSGFPPVYDPKDSLEYFDTLHQQGRISDAHLERHKKLITYRSVIKQSDIDVKNISSSEAFEDTNYVSITTKADFLGLDNIVLVKGSFDETMVLDNLAGTKFCAGILDCDLYNSYRTALPYTWQRLSPNGFLFLDEYYSLKFAGARAACDEFFQDKAEAPQLADCPNDDFERWYVNKQG